MDRSVTRSLYVLVLTNDPVKTLLKNDWLVGSTGHSHLSFRQGQWIWYSSAELVCPIFLFIFPVLFFEKGSHCVAPG